MYDKRDNFNFKIVNIPFLNSNIPTNLAYGVYVGRKAWIWTIRGLRNANHGFILCATIHGLHAQSKDRVYLKAQSTNLRTIHMLHAQTTDHLVCSQVQSNDKLLVSGIVLAS